MKNFCLLIGGMLILTISTIAQNKKVCNQQNDCCKSNKNQPVVTKGYYAIGSNANQLTKSTYQQLCCLNHATSPVVNHQPNITKGYYAIGTGKDSLLKKQMGYVRASKPAKVEKGYYAVGGNQQKLRKNSSSLNCSCDCDCG